MPDPPIFWALNNYNFSSSPWLQSPYQYKFLEDYFCRLHSGFHIHTSWSLSFLIIHQLMFNLIHIPRSFPENCCLLYYPILYLCRLFLLNTLHLFLLYLILFFSDDVSNSSKSFGILILLSTCSEPPPSSVICKFTV